MVRLNTLGAGAVALTALFCGSAQAATTGTMTVVQGSCGGALVTGVSVTGAPVSCTTDPARTDTGAIELVADSLTLTPDLWDFFSLGVGGYLLLQFSGADVLGITGTVYVSEETYSRDGYLETLSVYAGDTDDIATLIDGPEAGLLDNDPRLQSFDLGTGDYSYLLLVDTTDMQEPADGYDVMALQVSWAEANTPDIPVPAAGLLLGSAMLGFGAMRRRKQNAA